MKVLEPSKHANSCWIASASQRRPDLYCWMFSKRCQSVHLAHDHFRGSKSFQEGKEVLFSFLPVFPQ